MVSKYKKSGWYKESRRHALASRGIKTGRKVNYAYTPGDLPNIVTQGLGTAGATAVGWVPTLVTLGVAGHVVKKGKKIAKDIGFAKKIKEDYFNIKTKSPMDADKLHEKLRKAGVDAFIYDWGNNKLVTVNKKDKDKVKKLLKINFYKISSISNKDKLIDIRDAINRKLADRGFTAQVFIKDSAIQLSDIRISQGRIDKLGHNIQQAPFTKSGQRKTRALSWGDWVEVNDTVNDVLDEQGISANVKSLGGKFDIRDKQSGRRTEEDWQSLASENVGSMIRPVQRKDYINRPEKKETQFGILGKEGKITKAMSIDISKIKSDDPLAYSYGYFQGKSGQPMSKEKGLATEYIRGYKDAKAGKKIK